MATGGSQEKGLLARVKREAMVEMAIGIIAEGGLDALTFRRLAEVAGTSTAPFTTEFGTRQALIKEVLEKAWLDLGIKDSDLEIDDPLEALETVLTRPTPQWEVVSPELRVYMEMLVRAFQNEELRDTLNELEAAEFPPYVEMVKRAQASGQVAADKDPEELLTALWALGDGLLILHMLNPAAFPLERTQKIWEESFAALIA